jgi:hypothetical protein
VSEAFTSLHYQISSPEGSDAYATIIALGDYIDLDSLTIGSDPEIVNSAYTLTGNGTLLRLIVVGINSFSSGAAAANNPGAPGHVVFQFQNVPVIGRKMEETNINTNGYAGSLMPAYLMGDFLTGLKTATGLTNDMLWAPTRKVSHGNTPQTLTDTISTDTLWLPTSWEMTGAVSGSSQIYEVNAGQARLDYYATGSAGDASRIKYNSGNTAVGYWLASPASSFDTAFVCVGTSGTLITITASAVVYGVAPAFCVK